MRCKRGREVARFELSGMRNNNLKLLYFFVIALLKDVSEQFSKARFTELRILLGSSRFCFSATTYLHIIAYDRKSWKFPFRGYVLWILRFDDLRFRFYSRKYLLFVRYKFRMVFVFLHLCFTTYMDERTHGSLCVKWLLKPTDITKWMPPPTLLDVELYYLCLSMSFKL